MKKYIYLAIAIIALTLATILLAYNYMPLDWSSGEQQIGSTITTIQGSDTLKNSRAVINTNFSNLNTDKLEISTWYASTSNTSLLTLRSLNTVGTITSGTWNASTLTVAYGGTGSTTLGSNQVLLGNGTGAITNVAGYGSAGQILTSAGAGNRPYWNSPTVDTTIAYGWTGEHTFNASSSFTNTINISGNVYSNTNILYLTAGQTITGAVSPRAVYLASSTGTLFYSSASSTATSTYYDYLGFAISSGTSGQKIYVQTDGIVSGFSGLTAGKIYYIGTTTPGTITDIKPFVTQEIVMEVGKAVSTTQLLIQRRKNYSFAQYMADASTYLAYTDVYVYCLTTDGTAMSGVINGTTILSHSQDIGSFTDGMSLSFFVPMGYTFSCSVSGGGDQFTGTYYPFN